MSHDQSTDQSHRSHTESPTAEMIGTDDDITLTDTPDARYKGSSEEGIGTGDVVVDLATGKSLQVVSKSTEPADTHPETRSDPTAEMFGADGDDTVFNCVFLPDGEDVRAPSKTYAYPESRLLRYPVERVADGTGLQTHLRAAFLRDLAEAAGRLGAVDGLAEIVEAAYNEELAQLCHEWVEALGMEEDDA